MWSGGLIDSRSAVGVYMCQLGRHSVMERRDGEAGTVCAAISRTRRLGPQLSLGFWRDSTL